MGKRKLDAQEIEINLSEARLSVVKFQWGYKHPDARVRKGIESYLDNAISNLLKVREAI